VSDAIAETAHSFFTEALGVSDPDVAELIRDAAQHQDLRLQLIAAENFLSAAQLEAQGSILNNTLVEGYPGARLHGPSPHADAMETLAIERACELFGAAYANVQPHSGTQANQAVFLATLEPGDTVLSMALTAGGHFSHGTDANTSGVWLKAVHYGVSPQDALIDYGEIECLAEKFQPKLVIAGGSAYPRKIDFQRLASIAHAVGAKLMVDIAHVAGLVAVGLYPNPLPHADVVTTTTYKNLRGVQGGLVLCNDGELAEKIDRAVCPGVQGVPLVHVIAAKAIAFGEALKPEFKHYCASVLANAKALGAALEAHGIRLLTGGTDTPFVIAEVSSTTVTAAALVKYLDDLNVSVNASFLPDDPPDFGAASALRLGTSAITTRGMGEAECVAIGDIIADAIAAYSLGSQCMQADAIRKRVVTLCAAFPTYRAVRN